MKLLVRNLDRKTTEAELLAIFEAVGTVEYCTLVLDKETGQSKGFGFVEMPNEVEGVAARATIDNSRIKKNRVRVREVLDEAQG